MNELKVFDYQSKQIRTVVKDGEPWFVAKDVAENLGYTRFDTHLLDSVPVEWKGTNPIHTPGGTQEVWTFSEQGLYFFLSRSDKPSALPFQKWIAGEVVPSIRKHGAYMTENVIDQILNNPDFGIELLTTLKEERRKRLEAEHTNHILMHVNKTYTATEIAKELGFKSAMAFNCSLESKKIQYKQNETWVLYSQYADKGYVEIKQDVLDSGKVIYYTRWTQLGREFLLKLYGHKMAS